MFCDSDIDEIEIMSHIIQSETGTIISLLVTLKENSNGLHDLIHWKGLEETEDTLEPIVRVSKDVPQLIENILNRKSTPANLATKARA